MDLHAGPDVGEHRGTHIVSAGAIVGLCATTVECQSGSFLDPGFDHVVDELPGLGGDDGSHDHRVLGHFGVEGIGHHELTAGLDQSMTDIVVGGLTDRHNGRRGHATLSGAAETGREQVADDFFDPGIRHHHQMVFGATHGLKPFFVANTFLGHGVTGAGRAHQ